VIITDTIYRYLDNKLIKTREKAYPYLTLLLIAIVSFTAALTMGSILSNYLAKPFYFFYLKPALAGFDKIDIIFNSTLAIAVATFIKNSIAILFCIIVARRTRGISIAILLLMNGLIIGSLVKAVYDMDSSLLYILVGILPHGIFEFTALFYGAALGMRLVACQQDKYKYYKQEVTHLALKHVLPLLIAAALIESYLTPVLLIKTVG